MKANELMIGDWILMNNHKVHVTKLTSDKDYDNCNGIPLTAEILEKNGFVQKLNKRCYHDEDTRILIEYYRGCQLIDITINEYYEDEVTYSLPEPYNVHELQHSLRLCGLNKLADNFKI